MLVQIQNTAAGLNGRHGYLEYGSSRSRVEQRHNQSVYFKKYIIRMR